MRALSSYGARGKFGEHERSVRVARGDSKIGIGFISNFLLKVRVLHLRVTASKDRAKLEIDQKIKILKLCQNKAYHKPD